MFLRFVNKEGGTYLKNISVTAHCIDNGMPLILDLQAPTDALTNACSAHLMKYRKGEYRQETQLRLVRSAGEEETLYVPPHEGRKLWVTRPLPNGVRIVSTLFSQVDPQYVHGGTEEEPSEFFRMALSRFGEVAYLPSWLPRLWQEGIKTRYIRLVDDNTTVDAVWHVGGTDDGWQAIIAKLVRSGELYYG